jgi:hypothetical protein
MCDIIHQARDPFYPPTPDVEKTYAFAKSPHSIRIRRLRIVGRLVEEMLAAMLADFGYSTSATRAVDGSNSFDLVLAQEFQDSGNPLREPSEVIECSRHCRVLLMQKSE